MAKVLTICLFLTIFAGTKISANTLLAFPENSRDGARIVSGWEAVPGQFPFQISLRMVSPVGAVSGCGGTIIHPNWGLTAAHCTAGRLTLVVRAGAVSLTRPVYIFETTDYWNHPLYNENFPAVVQPNDIGVIRFNRELVFNDYVQPIRMQRSADMNRNYDGVTLTASGWGNTWTGGPSPENLNWVFLVGRSTDFCRQSFGGSNIIQDSTICAGAYNVSSQSICQGDSGGPLTVVDEDGKLSEVGVSSFVSGTGCHTDFPGGFIRPGHYHDWYYEVTGVNFDWDYDSEEQPDTEESDSSESESNEDSDSSESDENNESDSEEEEHTTTAPESDEDSEEEEHTTTAPESGEDSEEEEHTTQAPESGEDSEEEEHTTQAPESGEDSEEEVHTTFAPESGEDSENASEE